MSLSSNSTPRPSRNRSLPSRFRDGIEDAALSLDFDREPMNENARRRLNNIIANGEDNLILRRPTRPNRVRNTQVNRIEDIRMYEPVNAHIPRDGNISLQLSTIDFDREPMNENARRRLNDDSRNEEEDIMLQRPVRRSRVRNRELDDNDNVR
jgi:hypothetical protein